MCKKWAKCRLLRKASHYCKYKDPPMWKVGGKIVDGDVNPYCQYTAAGRFLCYVTRFIGGHEALVNVTTLIICRDGSRGRAREAWVPLIFKPNWGSRGTKKNFFDPAPPPSPPFSPFPLSQDLDDRVHPLSESLDPLVIYVRELRREIAAVTQLARKSEFSSCQVLLLQFQLSRFVKDESWTNS